MPQTGKSFQKEEEEMFKKIQINSLTSYQDITMFPKLRKLHKADMVSSPEPEGKGERGLMNLLQSFCKLDREKQVLSCGVDISLGMIHDPLLGSPVMRPKCRQGVTPNPFVMTGIFPFEKQMSLRAVCL